MTPPNNSSTAVISLRSFIRFLAATIAVLGTTTTSTAAPPIAMPFNGAPTSTPSTLSQPAGAPSTAKRRALAAEFQSLCEREKATSIFFGNAQRLSLEARLSPSQDKPADLQVLGPLATNTLRQGDVESTLKYTALGLSILKRTANQEAQQQTQRHRLLTLEAMAHFIAGETANCLAFNNAASCILPIRPDAVHRDQAPIQRAIQSFERLARNDPTDPEARWLLNLSHMLAGTYPEEVPEEFLIAPALFEDSSSASSASSASSTPRMLNVAPALGVDVMDLAGGGIVDDFDGDGFLDLISSSWDPCSSLRAFRSNGIDGFEDVTEAWGLDVQLGGLNLIHADVDNDGALDLMVLRGAWRGSQGKVRNSLLINRISSGEGFEDVTYAAGLAHPAYPTQAAAFSDYDLDGDLDLFVGNESPSSSQNFLSFDVGKRPYPSQLFQNLGIRNGVPVFRDVARVAGVKSMGLAKGVAWGDVDNDGDDDLYISNIGVNRLYINLGNGRFEDRAREWGVDDASRNFVCWFFDFDNDGDLDLFNGDYSVPTMAVAKSLVGAPVDKGHPRLYRNDGDHMTDISQGAGLDKPLLPMGANYGDLDGDGFEDIYIGTGLPDFTAVHPNVFLHNLGGKGFSDATFASRLGHLQKGHAVAFADLDQDGDLDLFEQLGGAFPYDRFPNALYLNPSNDQAFDQALGHHFLILELLGTTSNRRAVGARVAVTFEEASDQQAKLTQRPPRTVHRVISSGGSFGGSSYRLELGLGQATRIVSITIRWPGSSSAQIIPGEEFQLDRFYRIRQAKKIEQNEAMLIKKSGEGTSETSRLPSVEEIPFQRLHFRPVKNPPKHAHN